MLEMTRYYFCVRAIDCMHLLSVEPAAHAPQAFGLGHSRIDFGLFLRLELFEFRCILGFGALNGHFLRLQL